MDRGKPSTEDCGNATGRLPRHLTLLVPMSYVVASPCEHCIILAFNTLTWGSVCVGWDATRLIETGRS